MKKTYILDGSHGIFQVENGKAELYAVRIKDGKPYGRRYHFKTIEEGGASFDFSYLQRKEEQWGCIAKCADIKFYAEKDFKATYTDKNEFELFIDELINKLDEDNAIFKKRAEYSEQALDRAIVKLAEVNTQLSNLKWSEELGDNLHIVACKVICNYYKADIKIPYKDVAGSFGNLSEEILYLSGIRYKEFSLNENWWKLNGGAMICYFNDGTPVAVTPRVIGGYQAYDPLINKTVKVDARFASKLKTIALTVYRSLPAKKTGLKDIGSLLLGENLYKEIILMLLCNFLGNIVGVIPAIVSEQIFDIVVPENLRSILISFVLILIAFEFAKIGFSIISNLCISRIYTKSGLLLQIALWDRLLSLKIPFFNNYTTGELLQKINGIDDIKEIITPETLSSVFTNIFSFVYIVAMFRFNAEITPYILVLFAILLVVYLYGNMRKYKLHKQYIDIENKSMSFNHQFVNGMHRIKVSCAEERVYNIWSSFETERLNISNRIDTIDNSISSFTIFFDFISTVVVYFLVSRIENVPLGMFVAYISSFLLFKSSMIELLEALCVVPEVVSIYKNIEPILEATSEYDTQKTIPKNLEGSLEVNNATFRYTEFGRNILDDISFSAEEGESIGIVGLSGGGKTTLLKLLMGFYNLTSGKIYYGGYDLETIDIRYLRKQMGIVLQDGVMTVGDIYSNITDNDDSIEYADVINAIKKVGLEETINSLPEGLNTRIENYQFSAGEKQRLLIARAIVKNNKFIFLDEATGSLDSISQAMVLENIKDIRATTIIIAQRLATVQHCDKIIVIENGKIISQGSYDSIKTIMENAEHDSVE